MKEDFIRIPQADRLVGIPKQFRGDMDAVKQITEAVKTFYETHGVEKIEGLELEKSERDIEIINFIQNCLINFYKKYGREVAPTPLNKIHILKDGGTQEYTKEFENAAHSPKQGSILVDRKSSDLEFARNILHEQLHNLSYKALQITNEDNPNLETFRTGFSITTRDGKTSYFGAIEEALIELLVYRIYQEYMIENHLFDPREELTLAREEESERFSLLIDNLWKKNQGQFNSRSDIEELFIRAQIHGSLLPVARLIEKTYGKGSFRKIGQMASYKKASREEGYS